MINICPIEKSDYFELIEIEKSLFDQSILISSLENLSYRNSTKIWKIVTTKIIGFVFFYHVKDEVEIIKIGILKLYQRKSYGSLIINEIKKLNIKKIFLEVSAENSQAINFYLKNGFEKIGIRNGYYKKSQNRTDALRLLFKLNQT